MRRSFMAEHPWPDHAEFCEGKFGLELLAQGFSGGVFGDGSVYVHHLLGIATAPGTGTDAAGRDS